MSKRKWHVGELPAIGQVHRNGWQVHVGLPPYRRSGGPSGDQCAPVTTRSPRRLHPKEVLGILKKHVATQVAQVVEH